MIHQIPFAFTPKYFSEVRVPIVHLSLGEAAVVLAYIGMLIGLLVTDGEFMQNLHFHLAADILC